MKKIFLILLLFSFVYSKAQTNPCKCTEVSTQHTVYKHLCSYTGVDGPPPNAPVNLPDALWIAITYTEVKCGGLTRIEINSILISDALYNCHIYGCIPDPDDPTSGYSCPPYYPLPAVGDDQAWRDWEAPLIDELVPHSTTTGVVVLFPAGCQSLQRVRWPAGTVFLVTDDGGDHVIDLSGTTSLMSVPCSETICCVGEMVEDGHGLVTYRPVSPTACDNAIPDPSFVPTIGNGGHSYQGQVISIGPCLNMCPAGEKLRGPVFSTGINKPGESSLIELSANPTLVYDKVWFTSNAPITLVEIYDIQGKKVLSERIENNEMNIVSLKAGTYFMQVHYGNEGENVKTVKISKQ